VNVSKSVKYVLVKTNGRKVTVHGSRFGQPFTKESDAKRSVSKRQSRDAYEIMEILP
jgi:hypothetical protein